MYNPDSNTLRNDQNLPVADTLRSVATHKVFDKLTAANAPYGKVDQITIDGMNDYLRGIGVDAVIELEVPVRSTRLKMRVNAVSASNNLDNPLTHLSCTAVQSTDPDCENHVFGKYTPCGNLSFSVIPDVANQFKVGDELYLDLSLAS